MKGVQTLRSGSTGRDPRRDSLPRSASPAGPLRKAGALAAFCSGLGQFFQRRVTPDSAADYVHRRNAGRGASLSRLLRSLFRAGAARPYLWLFDASGLSKATALAWADAGDADCALRRLLEAGVYLTREEFVGEVPTRRGGREAWFTPRDFENPTLGDGCVVSTGGTRTGGTRTKFDLELLADWAAHYALMLAEHDALEARHAAWFAPLPGGAGISTVLAAAKVGAPVERWFAPYRQRAGWFAVHRMATHAVCHLARVAGAQAPIPEHVPLDQPHRIARWAARSAPSALHTYCSSALAVVRDAQASGLDLSRTCFFVTGEPFTAAKARAIGAAGARAVPMYGFTEAGFLGCGCAHSAGTDRVHLFTDAFAAIAGASPQGTDPGVLFTTLLPSTPKVLLNVSMGDTATLACDSCDCAFGHVGLTQTMANIRSTSRLTLQGTTYEQGHAVRVLEELLPSEFGGTVGDYQLLEVETPDSRTELLLVVSPAVGPLDEAAVVERLLTALGGAEAGHRMMVKMWRQASAVRVVRRRPHATPRGKVIPIHTLRASHFTVLFP